MMTGTVIASEESGQPAEVSIRVPKSHWVAIIGAAGMAIAAYWRVETKEPEVIRREVPASVTNKLDRIDERLGDIRERVMRMEIRLDNLRGERDKRVAAELANGET